jgi:hypothetical protein
VPPAATWNTHVRDNLQALTEWASYTPTWTGAGGNPALGNGTIVGKHITAGKLVHFRILLTTGSTTTYGSGAWRFTLPTTAFSASLVLDANGLATDTSATTSWPLVAARCVTTTTFEPLCPNAMADTRAGLVTSATPFTWATTDIFAIAGTYEAA